tara:strand:- start:102 stop:1172 length:1071 start_codon:yes stop_codon:yes gene_type:complete
MKHGGNIFSDARKLKINKSKIIDASASLVPYCPNKLLLEIFISEIFNQNFKHYPDRDHYLLKKTIAEFHKLEDINQILPGNGAAELFTWAANYACQLGSSCLPSPGFNDYARALDCWGGKYFYQPLPLKDFSNSAQNFPIQSKADVIWITNPHNPTGHLWTKQSLINLLNNHKLVICDEAFLPIVPGGEDHSLIPLIENNKNLLVIRSLTKLFGIPGLRIGYAIGDPNILNKLTSIRDPWPLNNFAISAGIGLIHNRKEYYLWTNKIHNWVNIEKPLLIDKMSSIKNLEVFDSSANYFLIKSKNSLTNMINILYEKRILIRSCQSFNSLNSNWARISLQNKDNNQIIFNSISDILK